MAPQRSLYAAVLALATSSVTPASLGGVELFRCAFDAFVLSVSNVTGPPFFPYVVTSLSGAPWLENGSISVFGGNGGNELLSPGNGLQPGPAVVGAGSDAALGPYTFLSVPWAGASVSIRANFTCFTDFRVAAFVRTWPAGAAVLRNPGGDAAPSSHFPQFSAQAGTALRSDTIGFVEWAGEMDSYGNNHGVGLRGYGGGRQSGPLLLYNVSEAVPGKSRAQALVLGPGAGDGTHLVHGILGVVADPAPAAGAAAAAAAALGGGAARVAIAPGCSGVPHTDEVGSHNAPGSGGGMLVQAGNASACCAACAALGLAACDSWVYDTDGTAGGNNCWPLQGIRGSKQGMTDRQLGIMWDVPCVPEEDIAPVASAPADGFADGLPAENAGACCVACATLGADACAAWLFNGSVCWPLANVSGTRAAPGQTFGVAVVRPAVLAAGVQAYIAALPPGFTSTFYLAGSSPAPIGGLNDAVYHYGAALRTVARVERMPREADRMRNVLSYWSDNGAFYFDGYWPLFFDAQRNTAEDVFLALKAYHASLGLTIGTYQMDPWWYGGK